MNIKWKKLPIKRTPQIREYEAAVRRGMKNQHVVKADSGWAVKSGAAKRASKIFPNQNKAISFAEKRAKAKNADIIIHSTNGKIKRQTPRRK